VPQIFELVTTAPSLGLLIVYFVVGKVSTQTNRVKWWIDCGRPRKWGTHSSTVLPLGPGHVGFRNVSIKTSHRVVTEMGRSDCKYQNIKW